MLLSLWPLIKFIFIYILLLFCDNLFDCFPPKVRLTVANLGDCRAVLSRKGSAIPLSMDHKPTNEDEMTRIKEAGGWVSNKRVNGVLAVSRFINFIYKKILRSNVTESC